MQGSLCCDVLSDHYEVPSLQISFPLINIVITMGAEYIVFGRAVPTYKVQ